MWELILTLEECISSIDCGIFSFVNDAEFTIKISNQYFLDLFFPEEIEGKTLKSVLLPTHFYELQDIIRQKIAENQRTFIYSMIILGRGFYTWQECRFSIKDYSDTEKLISCVCFDVTQSKNKSLSLKYENEIPNIALQKSFIDVWKFDFATKKITLISEKTKEKYSIEVIENVPNVFVEKEYIHPESMFPFLEMHKAIEKGEPFSESEVRVREPNGRYKWCRIKYVVIYDDETGSPLDAIGICEDITTQKDVQLRTLLDFQYKEAMISDAMCIFEVNLSRNLILKPDNRLKKLLGGDYSMAFAGLANDISNTLILHDDQEKFRVDFTREKLIDTFKSGTSKVTFEYRVVKKDGDFGWIRISINFIFEPMQGDVCALIYVQNITDTKIKELKLQSRAERDLLSKLYNRITTQKKIDKILSEAKEDETSVLFMLDLDNFKEINDSLGHLYGDAVISETALRLKSLFRDSDIIGRLGGDEFAVFIPNVSTRSIVENKAQCICSCVSAPVLFDNIPKSIGCSVGIAFSSDECRTFKDLYAKADKALYDAKSKGKNRYEFFS